MNPIRTLTICICLILGLTLSSCGREREREQTSAPTPTTAAAQAPVVPATGPTATRATEAPAPTLTPPPTAETELRAVTPAQSALQRFRSRSEFRATTTLANGQVEEERVSVESAFVATDGPYGSDESMQVTSLQNGVVETVMAIYQVGEQAAVKADEHWLIVTRDESGLYTMAFDAFAGDVQSLDAARKVGSETINGIATDHYVVDGPALLQLIPQDELSSGDEEIKSLHYNVWVAQEQGFVVKYELTTEFSEERTGADGASQTVEMVVTWSYEIYDFDGDVTVTWPRDAPQPGVVQVPGFADGEFPIPPQTEVSASMLGILSLTSQLSEAEVTQFYAEQLQALGWSSQGSFGFHNWTKGDLSLSMMIQADAAGGTTAITILPSE